VSSDSETFDSLLDQLARCPSVSPSFIDLCRNRQRSGIDEFGDAYLTRDNIAEGLEEACDGANYAIFETMRRAHVGKDDKVALALEAAHHFAIAYSTLVNLYHVD
jgi:hypothetical protein